ncbi:MAG TPA: chloride channel protein [Gallionellaceae bacterium]|nr:chloride channel protein [Gallionellaceae bacterium]
MASADDSPKPPHGHLARGLALMALAVFSGALAGLGSAGLHLLLGLLHNLFLLGHFDVQYDLRLHTPPSPWGAWVVLAPVAGGLLALILTRRFAPESQGAGVPDVLVSIFHRRGHVRPGNAFFQLVATALTIGSGGSAGREGPSMHIGAALASAVAHFLRLPNRSYIALVACGSAAAVAATFNAPFGAALFVLEIAALEWSLPFVLAVLLAALTGTQVAHLFFGDFRLLPPGLAAHATPGDWWSFPLLGVLTAGAAWVLIVVIGKCRNAMARIPGGPYLWHAVAMLAVGELIYAFHLRTGVYAVSGVGFATLGELAGGAVFPIGLLLALFTAKFLATALTLGTGGSGGIVSPALFTGAALGALLAAAANAAGIPASPALWALAGMGGVMAAATGSILGATIMILEITGRLEMAAPVLLTAIVAYVARRLLLPQSAYTYPLAGGPTPVPENAYARAWRTWRRR